MRTERYSIPTKKEIVESAGKAGREAAQRSFGESSSTECDCYANTQCPDNVKCPDLCVREPESRIAELEAEIAALHQDKTILDWLDQWATRCGWKGWEVDLGEEYVAMSRLPQAIREAARKAMALKK